MLAATNKKVDAVPPAHADATVSEQHEDARPVASDLHVGERPAVEQPAVEQPASERPADVRVADAPVRQNVQGNSVGRHLRNDKTVDATVEAEDAQDGMDATNVVDEPENGNAPGVDDVAPDNDVPEVEIPQESYVQPPSSQRIEVSLDRVANDVEAFDRRTKRPSKARRVALVVGIICVLALAVWSILSVQEAMRVREEKERQLEMAEQALVTPKQVDVVLGVPDEESAGSMSVALHVVGITRANKAVDEVSVVTLEDHTLDLLPGDYDISLVGNAISSEGKMYSGSVDSYRIAVALDDKFERMLSADDQEEDAAAKAKDAQGSGADASTQPAEFPIFVFNEIASAEITDEQIEAVRAWMVQEGLDPQPYVDAVTARRKEATDRLNAEAAARLEEQMRAAEEVSRTVDQQVNELEQQQEGAQPAEGQPAEGQPAGDQPVADQPAEQPAEQQPAGEQPVSEPAVNEQATE